MLYPDTMSENRQPTEEDPMVAAGFKKMELSPTEQAIIAAEARLDQLRAEVQEMETPFVKEGARAAHGRLMFRDITVNLLSAAGPCLRFLKDPHAMAEEPDEIEGENERLQGCLASLETYLGVMRSHPQLVGQEMTETGAFAGLRDEADQLAQDDGGSAIDHYVTAFAERVAAQDRAEAAEKVKRLAT
jgi:hypothetical protein